MFFRLQLSVICQQQLNTGQTLKKHSYGCKQRNTNKICSIVATKEQQRIHESWKKLLMLWVLFYYFQTNPETVFQVLYANEVLEERFDLILHFCTKENKSCSSTTLCKWLEQCKYFFRANDNKPCSSTTLCKWLEQRKYFFCAKENKPCSSTTLCKWSTWRMSWPNFMFFVTTCEQFRT